MADSLVPVFDLHCDLLMSLQSDPSCTPDEAHIRCSIPQLQAGGVAMQTLAIFCPTQQGSARIGWEQAVIFKKLKRPPGLNFLAAIENASAFSEEEEHLDRCLERVQMIQEQCAPLVYISLTWKHENRFGGGNETQVGLKPDGRELLRWMSGRGIAVDFSHTSDWLAHDILEFLDQEQLEIPVIASHSNFRVVTVHPRNLPDDIAREIFSRAGVIGLNMVQRFVGSGQPEKIFDHVQHALYLDGQDQICFGADFFSVKDLPPQPNMEDEYFFEKYPDASMYPGLIRDLERRFGNQVLGLPSANARRFIEEQILPLQTPSEKTL